MPYDKIVVNIRGLYRHHIILIDLIIVILSIRDSSSITESKRKVLWPLQPWSKDPQ